MSTKTLDFKSLTTKLTTEIFSFQFSIFNFIEPPGNAYTRTFAFSHLSFAIRQKKAFTSCPTSESGSFFYVNRLQSTDLVYAHLWTKTVVCCPLTIVLKKEN